jgi:hypothetical protein
VESTNSGPSALSSDGSSFAIIDDSDEATTRPTIDTDPVDKEFVTSMSADSDTEPTPVASVPTMPVIGGLYEHSTGGK